MDIEKSGNLFCVRKMVYKEAVNKGTLRIEIMAKQFKPVATFVNFVKVT